MKKATKKRRIYTDGWHDINDRFGFWVENGCIIRGIRSGLAVYPYRPNRRFGGLDNVSGVSAYYGVLKTLTWR